MTKKLFKLLSLAIILLTAVLACRTNEELLSENEKPEKIEAFINFENKTAQKESSGKGLQTISYAEPFSILLENYFKKHPEYAKGFSKNIGKIDLNVSSQTFGDSEKVVVFPILKNSKVINAIACYVNKDRDFVKFRTLENGELKQDFLNIFQNYYSKKFASKEIEAVVITVYQAVSTDTFFVDPAIYFSGGGGYPGQMDGGSAIHGSGGGVSSNTPANDPCSKVSASNTKAKNLLTDAKISAKKTDATKTITTDTNEKSFTFGKDKNGNTQTSEIKEGSNGAAPMPATDPNFTVEGGAHTHTTDYYNVASSGDIYKFYKNHQSNSNYNYYYTFSQDNNNYVYTITDQTKFDNFFKNYPDNADNFDMTTQTWNKDSDIGKTYNKLRNSFENSGMSDDDIMDLVMAGMLQKYDMGIALSKADSNGNFNTIFVKENIDPANPTKVTYEKTTNCNLK